MKRNNGSKEDGQSADASGSRQTTLTEKRVSLTVEFTISFHEITPQTACEMNPARDPEELLQDKVEMATVAIQGRLLRALLEDGEALRQFIACAVVEEVAAGRGELLREWLKVKDEEAALRPVIESLGGEVAEYYEAVGGEGEFMENIGLLLYSTPVRCVGVRGRVEDMKEEHSGESDKYLM